MREFEIHKKFKLPKYSNMRQTYKKFHTVDFKLEQGEGSIRHVSILSHTTFHNRIIFYVFYKTIHICLMEYLSAVALLCSMTSDSCAPKMWQLCSKEAPVVF